MGTLFQFVGLLAFIAAPVAFLCGEPMPAAIFLGFCPLACGIGTALERLKRLERRLPSAQL